MDNKISFSNIESTGKLEFEELSAENYHQLVLLFEQDSNPFIQEEYKNLSQVKDYYKGLLNLYDLDFDPESKYHKMCSIGYAIGEKHRQKGLTKEAVNALTNYTFSELNLECITASTVNNNIASISFLQSIGFTINTIDHKDDLENKYFELRKS